MAKLASVSFIVMSTHILDFRQKHRCIQHLYVHNMGEETIYRHSDVQFVENLNIISLPIAVFTFMCREEMLS